MGIRGGFVGLAFFLGLPVFGAPYSVYSENGSGYRSSIHASFTEISLKQLERLLAQTQYPFREMPISKVQVTRLRDRGVATPKDTYHSIRLSEGSAVFVPTIYLPFLREFHRLLSASPRFRELDTLSLDAVAQAWWDGRADLLESEWPAFMQNPEWRWAIKLAEVRRAHAVVLRKVYSLVLERARLASNNVSSSEVEGRLLQASADFNDLETHVASLLGPFRTAYVFRVRELRSYSALRLGPRVPRGESVDLGRVGFKLRQQIVAVLKTLDPRWIPPFSVLGQTLDLDALAFAPLQPGTYPVQVEEAAGEMSEDSEDDNSSDVGVSEVPPQRVGSLVLPEPLPKSLPEARSMGAPKLVKDSSPLSQNSWDLMEEEGPSSPSEIKRESGAKLQLDSPFDAYEIFLMSPHAAMPEPPSSRRGKAFQGFEPSVAPRVVRGSLSLTQSSGY